MSFFDTKLSVMAAKKEARVEWTCKCRKTAPETSPTSDKVNNTFTPVLFRSISKRNFQIRERLKRFILSDDTIKQVSNLFLDEVKKGLVRRTHDAACVKCYVTYVQDLPKGIGCCDICCLIFKS